MNIGYEVRSLADVIKLCALRPFKEFIKGQDELIESICIGLPMRSIIIEKTVKKWIVLSGLQRMQIITNFYYSGFMLKDLRIDKDLECQCFATLAPKIRERISNTPITCYFLGKTNKDIKPILIEMMEVWS